MSTRRTKIICTIGPASAGRDQLIRLIDAGMNGARLNFSHGDYPTHARMIEEIREAAEATGQPVAILQDLQGPKIRTGAVSEGQVLLEDGAEFRITTAPLPIGDAHRVGTTYGPLVEEVRPGSTILLDDGYIILGVERIDGQDLVTRVQKGGWLKNNKGIIAPGASLSAPSMSDKDLEDLRFGLEHGIDAVALSFVRSERDIIELRSTMRVLGVSVPVIAKIERYEGYEDIDDIIREADGIMVARGDLGLEMPAESVPVLQKDIIRRCNAHGKPVITATQMLESMISNPRPTRAEASDVANAVLDGTDCVMLSGETSVGRYPIEAVGYMDRIIRHVESRYPSVRVPTEGAEDERQRIADGIGKAACIVAETIDASAIVTLTRSGSTARVIAKHRPEKPILALTDSIDTYRRLALVWGIRPVLIPPLEGEERSIPAIGALVADQGILEPGTLIVLTTGIPLEPKVPTNTIHVQHIERPSD